ncbi:MAG: LptF/LptG family permease [Cephaloticoccus sp.]|nr:LptF/LptG family permease [Cephaloticoccus sp.]MCF7761208.1 LptF/LptG family permease [Cephaloticoccus sp.]
MFKSVLGSCLAAVGMFAFVLMLGNAIRDLLGYVLAGQLPLTTFGELLLLLVPFVVSYALPMGMLTGVLLTLGRLSADSEITAMRAAGISMGRVARPVLILGILGMATGLYVNFEAMPRARLQYQRELSNAVRINPLRFIVPRTFIRDFPGFVIYVGEKQGPVLSDFWLWELDDQQRVERLVRAESGRFDYDESNNALLLTLLRAQVEARDRVNPEDFSRPPLVGTFERTEQVRLSLDALFGRSTVRQKLKWMTYDQLQAEEARLAALTVPPEQAREHARDQMKVKLTIQEKFQNALAMLSFALIGVPLGIKVSRRETSANLGVAVALALGYYFLTVMVNWLDRHPEYRPDLLFWIPNLIFLALGLWLFGRLHKR